MVAHCSDFFQVCASSSFLVLTASSNKLMLSWKRTQRTQRWTLLRRPGWSCDCGSASLPSSTSHRKAEPRL